MMQYCPGVLFPQWTTCYPSPPRHPVVIPVLLNEWKRQNILTFFFLLLGIIVKPVNSCVTCAPEWKMIWSTESFYARAVVSVSTWKKSSYAASDTQNWNSIHCMPAEKGLVAVPDISTQNSAFFSDLLANIQIYKPFLTKPKCVNS